MSLAEKSDDRVRDLRLLSWGRPRNAPAANVRPAGTAGHGTTAGHAATAGHGPVVGTAYPRTVEKERPGAAGAVAAVTPPGARAADGRAPAARTGDGHVPALQARDLSLSFGDRSILSGISLAFPPNSVTALLGPTGSGKTTFLRTLNRMNDRVPGFRHTGDVLLYGHSLWDGDVDPMALRRRVGMLFQRPNPFPMSILDNVTAAVRAHGLAGKKQAREVGEQRLRQVGLWDAVANRLGDSPFRLSGGQQQLLCLARALAIDPKVLLLDEPTSSLDPVSTAEIEALIGELAKSLTVIVVTHNLQQARRIAGETAFFAKGRLIEHGPTAQVLERPTREETANYVAGRIG